MFDQWLDEHRSEIVERYVALRTKQGDPRPEQALRQGAEFGIDVSIKSVLGEMNWEQATRAGASKVLETGGSLETLSETARSLFLAIRQVLEEDRPNQAFEWLGIVGDYTLCGSETVAKVMEENLEQQIAERERSEESLARQHEKLEERVAERTRELTEVNRQLEEAQSIAHVGHWELDLVHDSLTWSDELFRILGFEPQQFEPSFAGISELVHPDDRESMLAAFADHLENDTEYDIVHRMVRPDGEVRYVQERGRSIRDDNGKALSALGTTLDITDRKLVEEQLALFRKLAEASGSGLGIAELDGTTTYLNPEACRMLELDAPESGYGKPIRAFHPADAWQTLETEALPAVMQAGEWNGETALISTTGKLTPVIQSLFLLRDDKGEPLKLASVLTDITERKNAEETLKAEADRLMTLFDGISEVIYVSDPDTYEILFANKYLREAFGKSLVGGICYKEFQDLDEPCEFCTNSRILANRGEAHQWEHHNPVVNRDYLVTDKIIRWPDGRDVRFELAIDITKQKEAVKALEESEQRYRTIFDTAGTGMISFGEDSVITMANEEWAKISGYSIDETVGKLTWVPFFSEKSLAKMKEYHEQRTKDPTSVPKAYEAQAIDRDGKIHEGIINIQMVPGTQQRVASFQDMTALKRAQQEMYRADKMAALGQIIAGVAHEINNPNNFIYFNLPILRKYIDEMKALLETHPENNQELKILRMPYDEFLKDMFKLLENMEHGSKRITSIVADLKNYVRSDEERGLKAEQLAQTIDRVMALVGKQVRKTVKRFDVEVADNMPSVQMNPGKIEQVLINLVINAGQAADKDDSWVKLSARVANDDRGMVELRVEDNGSGIPEEHLEQVFEPFFTSKSREQGTGLGLAISHRIVEEHGGTIGVESTAGEGTVFTIRLPIAGEA